MAPVAAIDAGSNAIRLAIIDVGLTGVLKRRLARRYALRLGSEVFRNGHIPAAHVNELLSIFGDIATRLQRLGVSRYRAVATSAMRDAKNGAAVVASIRQQTGIELEIISGAEEGRIMRMTLMRALGTLSSDCLLIDLGGGSLEIERTTDVDGLSLPWGTLRLLQHYPCLQEPQRAWRFAEVHAAIRAELAACLGPISEANVAIGTGGNLDALARLAPVANSAVPAINSHKLLLLARRVAKTAPSERAQRFNLRADRADIILPAAFVVLALTELFGLDTLLVPGTGIHESLLHTLVTEGTRPSHARELLQAHSYDLLLPDRRTRMAQRLFELLAALHGLWPPALAPLEAAAYLLDGAGSRDRHSTASDAITQILENPELDLDLRARKVAAHAIKHAMGLDLRLRPINNTDQRAAMVLGAILRLAIALVEASDAWEPHIDLTVNPIRVVVGRSGWVARTETTPLEQVLGRRLRII